ncbi:hypothetical protein [Streptomyces sp. NPDC046909]|uniref:hypothetical protein n=1 Tax=Streptomyces sp. NPDC046909 TaxID=3155617 RepID=UPI0033C876E8
MNSDMRGAAVADPFALYQISTAHTPGGAALRQAALDGELRILVSAIAFTVSCSMRTCWDEDCRREHPGIPGHGVQDFHRQHGFDIVQPTLADSVSAGRLYSNLADHRFVGPEVLAACSAKLLADARNLPLLSTNRALYCYTHLAGTADSPALELV